MSSSSIVTVLYNDYIRPYQQRIMILLVFVIFLVAAVYAYRAYAKPLVDNKRNANISNTGSSGNGEVIIYLFYADWCPHCTKAKPEWNKFKAAHNNKDFNGYTIKCVDVNCTEETNANFQIIQKYNLDSYPTLKMEKDGSQIDFDSKITNDSLEKFINMVLV
jgi:thiol-disulfide isomerase/thioredoxin